MRTSFLATSLLLASTAACTDSIGELPEPPVLRIISPERSLIQDGAGAVLVHGTVMPNSEGTPIKEVKVNDVAAAVGPDGHFTATLVIKPGAHLIHTVAVDARGTEATDTRSVEAGELRAPGSNIQSAVTTAISKNAFAKIAGAASTLITGMDFKPMLTPMNPVVHKGDEGGEDCLFARAYADDFKLTKATISLVPVNGGLALSAKLDGVDLPGRMRWAVACANGSTNLRIKATSLTVKATVNIAPNGMAGFKTSLSNETIQISGLDISASGIPGTILDILPVETLIEKAAPLAAKLFMEPMMNKALGSLAGPKTLDLMGKQMTIEARPSEITMDPEGALVTVDLKMLLGGAENTKGFIFTDNGFPTMDPGQGLVVGLADDFANSMIQQFVSTGMLAIEMPAQGGSFDGSVVTMTSPPMISADPKDGMMRLVLPDMMATYTLQGSPVAKAAINALVDLKINPGASGYGIAIELGQPVIHANALDDVPNMTGLANADLGKATELALNAQIGSLTALLGAIPLPAMPAGIVMKDMSVGADEGFVMVKTTIE
jgi:hypothetical protein